MSHEYVAWQHLVRLVPSPSIYAWWCWVFLHVCLNVDPFVADIDLKEAQRFFAQKFSCGASVTAEDEIIIQGDFTDDIIDVIQEKWPEVKQTVFMEKVSWLFIPVKFGKMHFFSIFICKLKHIWLWIFDWNLEALRFRKTKFIKGWFGV